MGNRHIYSIFLAEIEIDIPRTCFDWNFGLVLRGVDHEK